MPIIRKWKTDSGETWGHAVSNDGTDLGVIILDSPNRSEVGMLRGSSEASGSAARQAEAEKKAGIVKTQHRSETFIPESGTAPRDPLLDLQEQQEFMQNPLSDPNKFMKTALSAGLGEGLGTVAEGVGQVASQGYRSIGNLFKRAESRAIGRTARVYDQSPAKVAKAIEKSRISYSTRQIALLTPKRMAILLAGGLAGLGGLALNAASNTNAMVAWAALDNGIGGMKFFSNDLRKQVEAGTANPIDAAKVMEDKLKTRDQLIETLETSVRYNPRLWGQGQILLTVADEDSQVIQANADAISAVAAEAKSKGVTSDETELSWEDARNEQLQRERELQLQWRQEDEEYWDKLNAERQRREAEAAALKLEAREAENAFWEQIEADRKAAKEREREEDTAFYEALAKEREEARAAQAESRLSFGLL